MSKILIDANHSDEIRAVIVDGDRIQDFEVETSGKEQIKGNLYIGEVTRVEPSLQAAFIDYGFNRNGFLAFGEVHPQFFDLPEKERKELCKELEEIAARRRGERDAEDDEVATEASESSEENTEEEESTHMGVDDMNDEDARALAIANQMADEEGAPTLEPEQEKKGRGRKGTKGKDEKNGKEKRQPPIHRRYQVQDVLKEGQKILVQVVKEERGTKGAALTTYFSLPGRYTVLMPNTPYAGGISRKITNGDARRQLKDAVDSLKIPGGMGLIVRTAGVGQEKEEIQQDFKNLTTIWKRILKEAKTGNASECVHEDGSLGIRALRDMYSEEVDEIIISGSRAYKNAKEFAKVLMPDVAKLITEYKEDEDPLFIEHGVEQHLSRMHRPRVTLPSGGYIIINPTEALVSIDVNSGRATQGRNLEDTALQTNLEAAEEVGRQLRLRDLSGLIVVDFIDQEDRRNSRAIERAMRKAVRKDRARIQVGQMSEFGLIEISRQRLRASLVESTLERCPHCHGAAWVPTNASSAMNILRSLEAQDIRTNADRIVVTTGTDLTVHILNHKKDVIKDLENKYKYQIMFRADDNIIAPDYKLDLIVLKADGSESTQTREFAIRENPDDVIEAQRARPQPRRGRSNRDRDDRDDREEGREERKGRGRGRGRNRDDREERGDRDSRDRKPRRGTKKADKATDKATDEAQAEEKSAVRGRRPRRAKPLQKVEATDKNVAKELAKIEDPVKKDDAEPTRRGRRPRMTKGVAMQAAPEKSKDSSAEGKPDAVVADAAAAKSESKAKKGVIQRLLGQ